MFKLVPDSLAYRNNAVHPEEVAMRGFDAMDCAYPNRFRPFFQSSQQARCFIALGVMDIGRQRLQCGRKPKSQPRVSAAELKWQGVKMKHFIKLLPVSFMANYVEGMTSLRQSFSQIERMGFHAAPPSARCRDNQRDGERLVRHGWLFRFAARSL